MNLPEQHLISHVGEHFLLVLSLDFEDGLDLHLVLQMGRRMGRLKVLVDHLIDTLGFVDRSKCALQLFVLLIDRIGIILGIGLEETERHFDIVKRFEQFNLVFQLLRRFDQRRRVPTELMRN